MGPKYEFTSEIKTCGDCLLHRIKRLSDGKLGGWIRKESNLSQDGNCWVDDDAKVYGDAEVYGDARIYGYAEVHGDAKVYGKAKVYNFAEVYGNAKVSGNAEVYDNAQVYGYAWVHCNAKVYGFAKVYDDAYVKHDAKIYDNAKIYGNAWVGGNTQVYGDTKVYGDAEVHGDLRVNKGELTFGEYNEGFQNKTSSKEVVQDFIYKVDDSNKITTQTEYDSIEEFFNEPIANDIKLDTLIICTIDTKEPLIKLQKVEKENKLNYRFIVDITIDNGDNFSIKSTIETQEQLNQKLEQTIEALKQYPEFAKYVDDLESCL